MAFVIKPLGYGTASGMGTTDMYTVPANTSAIVTSIRLINLNVSATATANLFVKPSGSANTWRIEKPEYFLSANSKLVVDEVLTLGAGDKVQVVCSGSTTPSYSFMVNGTERT